MKPIVQAIRALPGARDVIYRRKMGEYVSARLPGLLIRAFRDTVEPGQRNYLIQIAHARSFDRWANSTHFQTRVSWHAKGIPGFRKPGWLMVDLGKEVRWCRRVIRSGLFDFNSHIGTIDTPWFMIPNHYKRD